MKVLLLARLAAASALAWSLLSSAHAAPARSTDRLHVLMLSGGGSRQENYRSHVSHLKQFLQLTDRAGVPRERVSVLASDGADPGADLAVLDAQPEDGLWLLDRTPLQDLLAPSLEFVNTEIEGINLMPATQASLVQWFRTARKKLSAGDTLLVFVTDHGENKTRDPWQSQITLWGPREALNVRQLRALLETLDPRVKVVTLMSQCFSGGFAQLYNTHASRGLPSGSACGFFSSTADRPAYGCFPESAGQDAIGHAFRFFEALAQGKDFTRAHREILVQDDSPDVPLRTSDVFLLDQLEAYARQAKRDLHETADALLERAWKDKARWEPELRLLDALGRAYGLFSPRSHRELAGPEKQLSTVLEQLERHGRLWEDAFADISNSNLQEFLDKHPAWAEELQPRRVQRLEQPARRELARSLLTQLLPFTEAHEDRRARIERVTSRLDTVNEVAYRMQVRLAAILRMRTLLSRIAAQVLVETRGTEAQKRALASLTSCEDFALPLGGKVEVALKDPPALPSYEQDLSDAQAVFPAWLGIQFGGVPRAVATRFELPSGASMIQRVFPDSPAARASLRPGDIVLGPPGAPFEDNAQVRSWTMLSPTETPLPMVILREGKTLTANITLTPYPSALPKLPTRPKEGEKAPALVSLQGYRGREPAEVTKAGSYMLFYWATWCGPCKAAVPELLRFAEARKVPLLAVTDEDRETLDAFFAKHGAAFPANVAMDPSRVSFVAYGISATPTFVLVDGEGNVATYARGYDPLQGLPLPGWKRQ